MSSLDDLFGAALSVPGAVDAALAAAVRARHEGRYTRYALLDRGRYEVVEEPGEPELVAVACEAAARATGRRLAAVSTKLLRFTPGSYVLARHDAVHEDNPVEVTIDLSPAAVPDAELHYRRRGQVFFRVPCEPATLAIVERGIAITRNHCYLSKLLTGACVVRFVALLRG